MDANGATFVYNGAQYVPYVAPTTMEIAAEYFGKAVSALTSASNYINGVVAPAAEPVASTIAQLQTSAAAQLPETVTSTLGKEVAVEGLGSTTAGAVVALAGPTVLPIVNYLWKGWGRSSEFKQAQQESDKVLKDALAEVNNDTAIEMLEDQIEKSRNQANNHGQKYNDSKFFSLSNIAKHTLTVLAPFCVLPQVGFTVAATAAVVGLTTRAITHVMNYRGEGQTAVAEHANYKPLDDLRAKLQIAVNDRGDIDDADKRLEEVTDERNNLRLGLALANQRIQALENPAPQDIIPRPMTPPVAQ